MVLYAYVCVCAFLLHRESPGRILGDKPLLFRGFYHSPLHQVLDLLLVELDHTLWHMVGLESSLEL
jgi:hypothetical protein